MTTATINDVKQAINEGRVTHSRSRCIGGPVICVYERNIESPSGCTLLAILDDNSETSALLGRQFSPLSPTEF